MVKNKVLKSSQTDPKYQSYPRNVIRKEIQQLSSQERGCQVADEVNCSDIGVDIGQSLGVIFTQAHYPVLLH